MKAMIGFSHFAPHTVKVYLPPGGRIFLVPGNVHSQHPLKISKCNRGMVTGKNGSISYLRLLSNENGDYIPANAQPK